MLNIIFSSAGPFPAVLVLSEVPPAPQSVHVEKGQMTWALVPEETNVTYTVQYRR